MVLSFVRDLNNFDMHLTIKFKLPGGYACVTIDKGLKLRDRFITLVPVRSCVLFF